MSSEKWKFWLFLLWRYKRLVVLFATERGWRYKRLVALKGLTPKRRAKGKFHYPTAGLFSPSLKMKINLFFSFRNCKKWCKKAQNAIISLSFPSYVNWQPPENRLCIGERARREVAWWGFGSPQAVVYEWIRLSIVLPYTDHLFSMTQTLLLRFCSNEAREMVMCLETPSGSKLEGVYKPHPAFGG